MPKFSMKIKWGKEVFDEVEANTDEEPLVFKAQVYALTGVMPERQKLMIKGSVLKDDSWDPVKAKLRNGLTILMMGSREEDIVTNPVTEANAPGIDTTLSDEKNSDMVIPAAGLTNLGNTCYMNATVQCLKSVPEFREALASFNGRLSLSMLGGASDDAHSITVALRDLYNSMENGKTIPPLVMLQVLHNVFPRFAERGQQGGYQQQDANECWVELLGMVKQKLKVEGQPNRSIVDQIFGLVFDTETKCIETDEEPVSKSKEKFLQYNCYIDKDVKYLFTGLKNKLTEMITKRSPVLDRDAQYLKTLRLSRLPGYLTIQMVRFQFKQKDAINAKILKDVKFPLMLDTYDLCSEELKEKLVPMRTLFKKHEDAAIEEACKLNEVGKKAKEEYSSKKSGGQQDLEEDSEPYWFPDDPGSNNSGYYELQAVLTHKGRSSNSGHYVAWVRYMGDSWLECNDDEVNPIHVDDVLKLSGGGDWHVAYLLLYGPRRLPVTKKAEGQDSGENVKKSMVAEEEKMETA